MCGLLLVRVLLSAVSRYYRPNLASVIKNSGLTSLILLVGKHLPTGHLPRAFHGPMTRDTLGAAEP